MATMPTFSTDGAARYDRTAEPIMAPFAAVLVEAAQIHTDATVLDFMCGPGFAARVAAERSGPMGTVIGVDPDPAMIEVASQHGAGYVIEWVTSTIDDLPLPNASADVVLSLHGAGALRDPRAALTEALRVVTATGSFAATIWAPLEANPYLKAHARALQTIGAEEELAVLQDSTAYSVEQFQSDLRGAGWHEPTSREATVRIRLPGSIAAAAERLRGTPWGAHLDPETARQAARSCLGDLEEYVEADGSLVVPFTSHLVRAYP